MSLREHSEEIILELPRLLFTIFVVGIIVLVVGLHVDRDIDTNALESNLIMNRVYYSTNCLAAEDVRPRAGTIDKEKMTDERLSNCIQGPAYVQVTLQKAGITASNNPTSFERDKAFCEFTNFYCAKKLVPVKTKSGDDDTLAIEIVLPLVQRNGRSILEVLP